MNAPPDHIMNAPPDHRNHNLPASLDFLDGLRIACVGDIILDSFTQGYVERISREAPIPILRTTGVDFMPGGAGNVTCNLASLGVDCDFLSVVGDDADADTLQRLLDQSPHIEATLIREPKRLTPRSIRYTSQKQQVFRADSHSEQALTDASRRQLLNHIDPCLSRCHALVLSDYGRGVLDAKTLVTLIESARKKDIPIIIDPRKANAALYRGASVITPNIAELEQICGHPCGDDQSLCQAGRDMAHITGANILITRGKDGITLVTQNGDIQHYPAHERDVIDVSGAGDTVVAMVAAGMAYKMGFDPIISLANHAAGLVVAKSGTATLSRSELTHMIEHHPSCPVLRYGQDNGQDTPSILEVVAGWRKQGWRVGMTNGCFDVFHAGHAHIINQARSRCDRLIVAINSDSSVRTLKGPSRPIVVEEDRCRIIASLRSAHLVVVFAEETPKKLIQDITPDVLVKGADYEVKDIVGADIVERHGGTIYRVPLLKERSTTSMIAAIHKRSS